MHHQSLFHLLNLLWCPLWRNSTATDGCIWMVNLAIQTSFFFLFGWNDGVSMRPSIMHLNYLVIVINDLFILLCGDNGVSLLALLIVKDEGFAGKIC